MGYRAGRLVGYRVIVQLYIRVDNMPGGLNEAATSAISEGHQRFTSSCYGTAGESGHSNLMLSQPTGGVDTWIDQRRELRYTADDSLESSKPPPVR